MLQINQSPSSAKSIPGTVTATAAGLTVPAQRILFGGVIYAVPAMSVPCVFDTEATTYRLVLCKHANGPALVLSENDTIPAGYEEMVYLARFRLESAADTCASVNVEVTRRTLTGEIPSGPVVNVATAPVLPDAGDAERVASRKRRRRIRYLRQQIKTLSDAGTTYSAMTASQKLLVHELTALLTDGVPILVEAVP